MTIEFSFRPAREKNRYGRIHCFVHQDERIRLLGVQIFVDLFENFMQFACTIGDGRRQFRGCMT